MATRGETADNGQVTARKIELAVERIVELAKPLRVIAFGSRARGNYTPDSDLDLAVIVEEYDKKTQPRPVSRADIDVWISMDLLVVSRKRHEFMKNSIISVHYDIAKEGIVLYDASVGSIDRGAIERIAG